MILPLIGLALIDATSTGTLLIPLLYLARPRPRLTPLLAYLAVITAFYFLVGIALLAGISIIVEADGIWDAQPVLWGQLIVGIALAAWGILSRTPDPEASARKWRRRLDRDLPVPVMMSLALGAGLIEVASMLPYLAAIGIIGQMGVGLPGRLLILAGYCLLMVVPALVLVVLRARLGQRAEAQLDRFAQWFSRQADVTLLWIAAIVGIWLGADAWVRLFM
ncbi:GAP family protein [Helcobacillus massiliensis]|uniref:GAP family protein n=1 Tax=Helcobacillus massiliensis TaxID=521392 RepID=UPI0021A5B764|nr:GAP family protein [Helcobacillus massiliensis]MCT1558534.1 GAP family protein [Helcobacillus massiliensis]MCT2036073.1 GAP family protein [Helcobacillus massiliensis]MCT2332773.1 GAP family protein [Helcobacillus massiliensis]